MGLFSFWPRFALKTNTIQSLNNFFMPYLTKSNSLRIIAQIDLKKNIAINGELYKKPIYLFSEYERNKLLALQELFRNSDKFLVEIYKPIKATDQLRYIYEGGKPAYHASPDCERLNSNFRNFEIPTDIRERGQDEVIRFREWFKKHQYLLDNEKFDVFSANLYSAFNVEIDLKAIDYLNSGIVEKENLNLVELEQKIDQLISQIAKYFNESTDEIKNIIKRFGRRTFLAYTNKDIKDNDTNLTDENLKKFLKKYDVDFKVPISDLLVEYYRVKYNPDLKFEGDLLEKLGFKPCASCYTIEENLVELTDEIFSQMKKSHQLLICIHETYICEVSHVVKYDQGYGISNTTLDSIADKLKLR